MPTVSELLKTASRHVDRYDARVLLAHLLNCRKESFIAHPNRQVNNETASQFLDQINRVALGYPVPYLTQQQGFWSRQFYVTPDVLIPRPDTETVIEKILEITRWRPTLSILDLGTGSGCIAITLALEVPQASVTATDASQSALEVARENATRLKAEHIDFRLGSWYEPIGKQTFDIIVSNPPYIVPNDPHLPALRYEPQSALNDGVDGLSHIRTIVTQAPAHINPDGWLLLEHGYDQGKQVRELLRTSHFIEVDTIKDYGGNERITFGHIPA